MSHAERGKTFWIREFLAGMRLCRACGATPFRLPIPIFNFGGGSEIRTHDTLSDIPHFECGPFNHSGIPPFFYGRGGIISATHRPVLDKCGPFDHLGIALSDKETLAFFGNFSKNDMIFLLQPPLLIFCPCML